MDQKTRSAEAVERAEPPKAAAPTREEALSMIESAPTLGAVMEVANKALGAWREGWGDALPQAAAAALAWGTMSFPAAAAATVRFEDPGRAEGGLDVDGALLVEQGLAAAKLVAAQLLAPLPPESARAGLEGAMNAVQKGLDSLVKPLRAGSRREPEAAAPFSRRLDGGTLIGVRAGIAIWDGAEIWEDSAASKTASWTGLAAYLEDTARAETGRASGAVEVELGRLREACGFEMVAAGPIGGMGRARAGAGQILEAAGGLARAVGAPSEKVAGLGGLLAYINCDQGDSGACFLKTRFAMSFGPEPHSLGHEWTHALDDLTKKSAAVAEARPALDALGALERRIKAQPKDGATLARAMASLVSEAFEEIKETVEATLEERGREPFKSDPAERAKRAEAIVAELAERVSADVARWMGSKAGKAKRAPGWEDEPWEAKGLAAAAERMEQAILPLLADGARPPSPEGARGCVDCLRKASRRAALLGAMDKRAKNFFELYARHLQDVWPQSQPDYWLRPSEFLARSSEGFFLERPERGALVYDEGEERGEKRWGIPQGAEREALNQGYGEWMRSAMPWLGAICGFDLKVSEAKRVERAPESDRSGAFGAALAAFGAAAAGAATLVEARTAEMAEAASAPIGERLSARRAGTARGGAASEGSEAPRAGLRVL